MKLSYELKAIHLRHPFILSGSQYSQKHVIIISLQHEGIEGIGESSPSRYYGEPPESVCACLDHALGYIESIADPMLLLAIHNELLQRYPLNSSARSGVMMALYDWVGKKLNIPLYRFLGVDPLRAPKTTFTIGMDEPAKIQEKIREADPYPILKIKLGAGEQDYDTVKIIRALTDKPLRVDVNEGWTREEAATKIDWLATQNVELIEQPLPKENLEDMLWLKMRTPLPIYADENVQNSSDIPSLHGAFHGINIKLDKCGGITEALRMIAVARALDMKVMLGCMVQTSVGISAAAHWAGLVDHADLDGHLLIKDDPYHAIDVERGTIILRDRPGLGVEPAPHV